MPISASSELALQRFVIVSPQKILPNPEQPRRRFSSESLKELTQSLRNQGVIQPLIVRESTQHPGMYELIAGERRWRAAQQAQLSEIPVVIRSIAHKDLKEIALIENIQREDLTAIEEALCYRDLMVQHGFTQEQLAQRLGKNRSTIANQIRLLQLPTPIQNDVEEGRLSSGHARSLLSLSNESDQLHFREKILRDRWSVRKTEKSVKQWTTSLEEQSNPHQKQPQPPPSPERVAPQIRSLENELARHLQTKVTIQHKKSGSGSIQIEYYSLDDFERLWGYLKT